MALRLAFDSYPCSHFNTHCRPFIACKIVSSASRRRHYRRRLLKYRHSTPSPSSAPSYQNLQIILTVDRLSNSEPVNYLDSLLHSSQLNLGNFLCAADEAFNDLRNLVTVDSSTKRVTISCRRSTVKFVGMLLISSLAVTFIFSSIIRFLFRKYTYANANNDGLVYRRDRSLGGKEVIVGKTGKHGETARNDEKLDTLMMMMLDGDNGRTKPFWQKRRKRSSDEKLPNWWPVLESSSGFEENGKKEYQKMANRLIRAISDKRMRGEDISATDIVQLRRICKTSGVKARIDPENARYSFYRAAIDFVLNCCESTGTRSFSINVGDEDPQHFIAGLSESIDLESSRAARMVSAAVAARTRSRLLQAWALEIQGKHPDAAAELLKICFIHWIFPPDKYSPELEMVASSLQKQLNLDQREFLLAPFARVCGKEAPASVAEALGLIKHQEDVKEEEQDDNQA